LHSALQFVSQLPVQLTSGSLLHDPSQLASSLPAHAAWNDTGVHWTEQFVATLH
jgi:hypothetical protein